MEGEDGGREGKKEMEREGDGAEKRERTGCPTSSPTFTHSEKSPLIGIDSGASDGSQQ